MDYKCIYFGPAMVHRDELSKYPNYNRGGAIIVPPL